VDENITTLKINPNTTTMKKIFYTLPLLFLVLNLNPNVCAKDVDNTIDDFVVIICNTDKNVDCEKRVPDSLEFVYTVITKNPTKRFDNLSKIGKVYKNKDGEMFTFTGEYMVLKTSSKVLDPFYIHIDVPVVVGTAL
jgi:hypothetical protein